MGALPEYENVDNAQSVMPEYGSPLTQMWQYQNRSADKFLKDAGVKFAARQYANNAAAIAAGLTHGDFYVTVSGSDLIVKIVN